MFIIDPFSKSQLVLILVLQNLIQFDVFIFVGIVVWYNLRVEITDIVLRPQVIRAKKILKLHSCQKWNVLRRESGD
jgi:hypothetical protein